MCPQKKRYAEKDLIHSRIALQVFIRFFKYTTQSKKEKTIDDFINSQYYIAFVKFARYLVSLAPIYCDDFIDFVIKNGVKLKDWDKAYVYETFLVDIMRREKVEKAFERSITHMCEWAAKHETSFDRFFYDVSPFEAAYMIKRGHISPWLLYTANTAGNLLDRLNQEQIEMIMPIIDPDFWNKKINREKFDTEFAKELITNAGL